MNIQVWFLDQIYQKRVYPVHNRTNEHNITIEFSIFELEKVPTFEANNFDLF